MMAHSSMAVSTSPEITTRPEGPVVEQDVEQHEDQAGDAGAESGHERGVPQGGRDGLGRGRLQRDRQRTEVHGLGQVLRVGLGQVARDLTLAVERA